jgi:carbonic anhydrase
VLQFAVDLLRVRHVQDVSENHAAELDTIADPAARERRLCELNVVEQVRHVCEATVVQDAWAAGRPLAVHGWIYGLDDGLLRDLECAREGSR